MFDSPHVSHVGFPNTHVDTSSLHALAAVTGDNPTCVSTEHGPLSADGEQSWMLGKQTAGIIASQGITTNINRHPPGLVVAQLPNPEPHSQKTMCLQIPPRLQGRQHNCHQILHRSRPPQPYTDTPTPAFCGPSATREF